MRDIAFAIPGDIDTPTGGYRYDRALIGTLRSAGYDVAHLELGSSFPLASAPDLEAAAACLEAVDADRVLMVDGLAYSALPAEILRGIRAPIVALVHHPLALETGLEASVAARLEASERLALEFARGVVVTSPHTADILVANYGVSREAITVALPGLSPFWSTLPREPASPPVIASVGSISPRKGFDVLVDALELVRDLEWRCEIVGSLDRESATARALIAQIDRLGLGARIMLRGALEEAEIGALYRRASLFALATRYEGFGMVFAEAMAAGLPIVGTTGGAVPGVVPKSAGHLAPPDDAPAFAAALRTLLTDDAERRALGEDARAVGAQFGDWHETARVVAGAIEALG